jgi:hypothetical protein
MHPAAARALFEEETKHFSQALCQRRGWVLHTLAYPVINLSYTAPGRTPLRLAFTCDNWNELPPSIRLETPDGAPLHKLSPNPTGVFHAGPHESMAALQSKLRTECADRRSPSLPRPPQESVCQVPAR